MPFLSSSLRTSTIQLSYSNIVIINCAGLKFTGSSALPQKPTLPSPPKNESSASASNPDVLCMWQECTNLCQRCASQL